MYIRHVNGILNIDRRAVGGLWAILDAQKVQDRTE